MSTHQTSAKYIDSLAGQMLTTDNQSIHRYSVFDGRFQQLVTLTEGIIEFG